MFASDHAGYCDRALEVFSRLKGVSILSQGFKAPVGWVETYFQQKGLQEGRNAYFVTLEKAFSRKFST